MDLFGGWYLGDMREGHQVFSFLKLADNTCTIDYEELDINRIFMAVPTIGTEEIPCLANS
jgi:hypothetical protein